MVTAPERRFFVHGDAANPAPPGAAGAAGEGLAAPALFVPVTVDAMTITYPALNNPSSWTPPRYAAAGRCSSQPTRCRSPQPNRPGGNRDFTGIILHWALPDGLTRGSQSGARGGQVSGHPQPVAARPQVPRPADLTRWTFHSIIIASDYVGDPAGSPYPGLNAAGQVIRSYLGRTWPLASWPGEAAIAGQLLDPPLTAVGPGDATFGAFAPNVRDVLGVADPLTSVGNGPISYALYGWYGDPAHDPLYGAAGLRPGGLADPRAMARADGRPAPGSPTWAMATWSARRRPRPGGPPITT